MKVTINSSGHLPLAKSYDVNNNAAVPNQGDTVLIDGAPLEVYERVFDFNKPGVVHLLCRPKLQFGDTISSHATKTETRH